MVQSFVNIYGCHILQQFINTSRQDAGGPTVKFYSRQNGMCRKTKLHIAFSANFFPT